MDWSNKQLGPLSLFLTPCSARSLTQHCLSYRLSSSHLQLLKYGTFSAGHLEEMQNKNLGGFMALIQGLWYLDKYVVDCGNIDAVVVVDETPAMAAKIAMSDGRTKVAFLAVSAIKQKDFSNAVGRALQPAIVMQYMLEDHQMEQGVTSATLDTQEQWLLHGIPLCVLDSDGGQEGHQKPPKNRSCLRPPVMTVSLLRLSLHLPGPS